MKKLLCILLMLFTLPALAEEATPFVLTAPEGVTVEADEDSATYVSGVTRVVAITISRVPDEAPAEAVIRLMGQFDPQAVIGEDFPLAEGFYGMQAVTADKFGPGVDALTAMVLSASGDLLILSAYDMQGDESAAQTLLDALLLTLAFDGENVYITKE